ncbi:ArgE/DapE family deacylase [Erysipelothrix sp. HDW6C]|uniref:ArgE/DapE family deacylase n=1 Tax=Erysipelothrix sp. HDW6C TaxID=2714930 RepID=UPI00140CB83D|nr:ArgE/DapE family deacylase [Erysipelothrix sp. HDW6C]QIK70728.1 ArgE/DapE family deacylase [Erysipelothrix sp. HDW6C]
MEKQKKIEILQDVIRIESINGNEKAVALYLQKLLKDHGIESTLVDYAPDRSNLVATMKSGEGKVLAYSGHMDVVDPGDASLWKYPPFDAHIEGNKMYGRGTTDMKSGLVAQVLAMIEMKEQGIPFKGTLKLLATVGEEVGELGAEQLTTEGYMDDVDGLIIGEPTNYILMYTHMGSINYTLTSKGKEAHSSMPQLGINAINHLNVFITRVNEAMDKVAADYNDATLGRTIHNVTVISGGNQVNSIPALATLQGNIRSLPEFDNDKVIALLQKVVDELNLEKDYNLTLAIDFNKIPVKADKDSSLINTVQGVSEKHDKGRLQLVGAAGTTDAAEFTKAKKAFDFVVFGPGVSTLAHQMNEYVEIDNYLEMIEIYKDIAASYLK